jgi:hypothetical protein
MNRVSVDIPNGGSPAATRAGVIWPLSWWQLSLAVLLMSHSRHALDRALLPSTASRPFWDNFFNLADFGPVALISAAHFFVVGVVMALAIKLLKGTVDAKSVFSWLLMLPAAKLFVLLVASIGILTLWESPLPGLLYFGLYPGAPFPALTALFAILVLVAKLGGRLLWGQSVAVAICGAIASFLIALAWIGWHPTSLLSLTLGI